MHFEEVWKRDIGVKCDVSARHKDKTDLWNMLQHACNAQQRSPFVESVQSLRGIAAGRPSVGELDPAADSDAEQ